MTYGKIVHPDIIQALEYSGVTPNSNGSFDARHLKQAGIRSTEDCACYKSDLVRVKEEARVRNCKLLLPAEGYTRVVRDLWGETQGIDFGNGLITDDSDVYEISTKELESLHRPTHEAPANDDVRGIEIPEDSDVMLAETRDLEAQDEERQPMFDLDGLAGEDVRDLTSDEFRDSDRYG